MKKLYFLKPLLILLFMFFICFKTIDYLYKNNDVSNEEYIKLLLSDSYKEKDNNFYTNLIDLFANVFNPKDMLEMTINDYTIDEYNYEKLKLVSKHIINTNKKEIKEPLVYIYNTHQLENYSKEGIYAHNITPNVMMSSYLLKESFEKRNIESVVLDEFITTSNNFFDTSKEKILEIKKEYPSIKYYIDVHRSNILKNISTITIDNISYARIYFIIGMNNKNYEKNYELATRLSSKLNEKYPGISRGIYKRSDCTLNQNIDKNIMLIEFGGIENTIDEVMNTIDAFSIIFNEYVGEDYGQR